MATPPPRGVGFTCELLKLGKSIIFFLKAYFRTLKVNTKEIRKRMMKDIITFISNLLLFEHQF